MRKRILISCICIAVIIGIVLLITMRTNSISGYFYNIRIDNELDIAMMNELVKDSSFNSEDFKADYYLHPEDYKMYTVSLSLKNNKPYSLHWLRPSISHCPSNIFYEKDQWCCDFSFDHLFEPKEISYYEEFAFLVNTRGLTDEEIQNTIKNLGIRISYQVIFQDLFPLNMHYSLIRHKTV